MKLLKTLSPFEAVGEAVTTALVLACFALFLYYLWRSRGMPPGPWGLPLLGFLPWLDPKRPHLTLAELALEYGPIYSLRLGELSAVVLSHPSLVREALSKEVFTGRAPLWLTHGLMNNNGLIAVEGEKWREQRKFIVSCLKNLGAVKVGGKKELMRKRILEAVREAIALVEEELKQSDRLDPHRILAHSVGNLMNLLVFGKTFSRDDVTWIWLQELAEEGVKLFGVAGIINFIPVLRFLPKYSRLLRFVKEGQLRTHEIYREIAREPGRTKDNILNFFAEAMSQKKGVYFDEQQMLHLLADMFGAGIDTTLATLRWFLLYMALNPQAQEIAYEEVDSAAGKRKELVLDDITKCPYTEAAIYETMRIRPVVPLGIPHGTLEDTTLAGYRIPRGTMIMVNQWSLHHDPQHWSDPEVFQPKRFISQDGAIKKSDYFNPFQNGKRVCVGEELVRMVLFLFAANILRKFRLEVEGDCAEALEGTQGITNSPGHQEIRFTLRSSESRLSSAKVEIRRQEEVSSSSS